MKLQLGAGGQVEGFRCHDGTLLAIGFGEQAVTLQIQNSAGTVLQIEFICLARMMINDLREGNILDRFYLWQVEDLSGHLRQRLEAYFGSGALNDISSSGFILSMECSYGAELFGLIETDLDRDAYLASLAVKVVS